MRTTRFVDLGLTSGTLWANKNVGADRITDAGVYMSYPSTFFYKDKNYHIPTREQFEELIRECTWKWTEKGDVHGYHITGKNGAYIFLPAVGYYNVTSPNCSSTHGFYWSSTYCDSYYACFLYLHSFSIFTDDFGGTHYGMPIRLVINSTHE
jgi:hypothetical protein